MNTISRIRRAALGAALLTASALPLPARAESLWDRRNPSKAFLFYDTKARHVGDSITVIVDETTDVDNNDDRELSKVTSASKSMDVESSNSGDFSGPVGAAAFDFNSDSERSFQGDSSFTSEREFTTRVSATVIDVLPNGNMVIEGRRNVTVTGDERVLIISGIVRPYDVGADNSITSRNIAQFRITYDGNGQEQSFVRQGIFGRLMNKIWPW